MKSLKNIISVSDKDKPYIDFEKSIDDDLVVSGYIPVKSTVDVIKFLRNATSAQTTEGRGIICWGNYGTGKSRLCVLLARLFRDGFDCKALQPVLGRLEERGYSDVINDLKSVMMPGGMEWRKWLVVPMYGHIEGGTLGAALIKSLLKAIKINNLSDEMILGQTIYQAAAFRLIQLVEKHDCEYEPQAGSPFADYKNLERALLVDLDDEALEQFKEFHKKVSGGIGFNSYLAGIEDVAMKVHDVYNTAVKNIKPLGYAGIIILWDEFGFAVEKLLKRETLPDEVLELQDFLQKSCSNDHYDQRVIFLGFTHVSLSEYGTRANLGENEQNRLKTVEDRFRDPSIRITLGITESEGYHLLGGLTSKTEEGKLLFKNPIVNLQNIAEKMPTFDLWDQLSPSNCYDDIIIPCYPFHPSSAIVLLVLSDKIAQQNRTSFYFIQNRDSNGFAWFLENVDVPLKNEIGSTELMRIHHLFDFFEQAIMEDKNILYDQYNDAVSLYPRANELERNILKTVLILRVIANPHIVPTTDFISFCFTDSKKDEAKASIIHEALKNIANANVLWKNDATDVWDFVGGRGLTSEIEEKLRKEKADIIDDEVSNLVLIYEKIQKELSDYIGEVDLDPSVSGIVRKISIRILDLSKGIKPKKTLKKEGWLSAIIYLVLTESASKLSEFQQWAIQFEKSNIYFVIPQKPHEIDKEKLRELIAVLNLSLKTETGEHEYDVLEGKLTNLRSNLRSKFENLFGNEGFRSSTIVIKAGEKDEILKPSSWNNLLTIVGQKVDNTYNKQIKVRCGTFNVWKEDKNWRAISNIVDRILKFDNTPETQKEHLGFNVTSQEAAIIDGVLLENNHLIHDPIPNEWKLLDVNKKVEDEALALIYKHFIAAGKGKEFKKLFNNLISTPYGIPNGIIPLLIALVFRNEINRIGVTRVKNKKQHVVAQTKITEAIVDMGKGEEFITRYQKLNSKQRLIFYIIGQALEGLSEWKGDWFRDEEFVEYCDSIKNHIHNWLKDIPQDILKRDEFTENEKELIKMFRLLTPPHLTDITDKMVEIIRESGTDCITELENSDKDIAEYPFIKSLWRSFHSKITSYEEGIQKGAEEEIFGIINIGGQEKSNISKISKRIEELDDFNENQKLKSLMEDLNNADEASIPIDIIVTSLSGKTKNKLSDEDYARAAGFLQGISSSKGKKNESILTFPSGKKHIFQKYKYDEDTKNKISKTIDSWCKEFECKEDQLAFMILDTIYQIDTSANDQDEN